MNLQTDLQSAKKRIFSLKDLERYLNIFNNGVIIKHYIYKIVFDGNKDMTNNTNIIGQDDKGYFTYYVNCNRITNLNYFRDIKELLDFIFSEIQTAIDYYKVHFFEHFILIAEEDAFLYFTYKGNEYITSWQYYEGCYKLSMVNYKEANETKFISKDEYYGEICNLWDFKEMGLEGSVSYNLYQKDSWKKTKKYIIKKIEEKRK